MDTLQQKLQVRMARSNAVELQRAALEQSKQQTATAMLDYRRSISQVVGCYEESIKSQKMLSSIGALSIIALGALITLFINPIYCLVFIAASLILFFSIRKNRSKKLKGLENDRKSLLAQIGNPPMANTGNMAGSNPKDDTSTNIRNDTNNQIEEEQIPGMKDGDAEMWICPICGRNNPLEAKFCPLCGYKR